MAKEVVVVFQDCAFCDDAGRKKIADFAARGINIRKVSFASPEGKELVKRAVFEHRIGVMPFYTDGNIFATNLDFFIEKEPKKTKKKTKGATHVAI